MPRSSRQNKIIEIIAKNEIDTQDELVSLLEKAGFKVTQATISRDIKELGLIKITGNIKKYKYAFINSDDTTGTNKYLSILKESVINVKEINGFVVIKVIRGSSQIVGNCIDRLSISGIYGIVYGDDTLMLIIEDNKQTSIVCSNINELVFD